MVCLTVMLMVDMLYADKTTINPRMWRGGATSWPEEQLPELKNRPNSALALAGGGTRAYIGSIGLLRAMLEMGALQRFRYLTGVSGGSWAVTSFSFHGKNVSDTEFLCNLTTPAALTMQNLQAIDPKCARGAPVLNNLIERCIANFFDPRQPKDEFWTRGISDVFLAPYGISGLSRFTWNEDTKSDLIARNPALEGVEWVLAAPDDAEGNPRPRPYPIVSACVLGPKQLAPYDSAAGHRLTNLELSPLYTGHWRTERLDFQGKSASENVSFGGLLESFGFGGAVTQIEGLKATAKEGIVRIPAPIVPLRVADLPGMSSWAFGKTLQDFWPLQWMNKLENPRVAYWSPTQCIDCNSTTMYMGDGGTLDNTNLLGMLQRGVSRIVVMMTSAVALTPRKRWDPSTPQGWGNISHSHCSDSLNGYFGVGKDTALWYNYSNNQVFPEHEYATVVNALQDAQERGNGAVATTRLTTVANQFWGIEAGFNVTVMWIYVGRAYNWEAALKPELKRLVVPTPAAGKWEPTQHMNHGPFADFPNWPTHRLHLSPEQANLFAELTAWIALQHRDNITALLLDDDAEY